MIQISQKELANWKKRQREFVLIDVREQDEHFTYNIGGYLVPLSELSTHFHRFDTELPVVVYCEKGIRSQIAIQRLQSKFPQTKFFNLTRGIKDRSQS